jgi:hypothetical protein
MRHIDEEHINAIEDVRLALLDRKPGETVRVEVESGGESNPGTRYERLVRLLLGQASSANGKHEATRSWRRQPERFPHGVCRGTPGVSKANAMLMAVSSLWSASSLPRMVTVTSRYGAAVG